jgi:hypothetical protein
VNEALDAPRVAVGCTVTPIRPEKAKFCLRENLENFPGRLNEEGAAFVAIKPADENNSLGIAVFNPLSIRYRHRCNRGKHFGGRYL